MQSQLLADRSHGFQDHAGDVDDDQRGERGIEQPRDAAARLLVLEDGRKLPARLAVAEFGHAAISPKWGNSSGAI